MNLPGARRRIRERRASALSTIGLALALTASAETLPKSGGVDPRIRSVLYNPDEVYRLYGYVGFHLDLEFEADEPLPH